MFSTYSERRILPATRLLSRSYSRVSSPMQKRTGMRLAFLSILNAWIDNEYLD